VPIAERVIKEAVARYDRERDRYLKLASRVADLCRTVIVEDNAIRAQVTFRTKTIRSFDGKLRRFARRADKNFASVDEIFEKIGDFAGVRVATYRPEDEVRVTELLEHLFCGPAGDAIEVDPKDKLDPGKAQFYRATHCQVYLREQELVGDYGNLRGAGCEVQICSMMAHVWNEIEHDIGYKPEGGGPGDAEQGLLQILGHLTRSGDVTITQLLAANTARMTAQTGDFSDVYDFVARLRPHFPEADLSVNAGPAFDVAMMLGLSSVEKIEHAAGPEALQSTKGATRIASFNAFLEETGRPELTLNPGSADLVLIALLTGHASQIEEALSASRGQSRPGRVYALARAYQEFASSAAVDKDAA
jgi:ppGpp synthetase/RelA/SpoT-type nucleotidyltranferase